MLPSRSLHLTMRTYDSSMRASVILPSFKQSQSFSPRCALPQQESDFAFFKKHPLGDHSCVFNHPSTRQFPLAEKRIASQKSFFVRCKYLFSSDSVLVFPPRLHLRSSTLEQERNMAYVTEKEEDVS